MRELKTCPQKTDLWRKTKLLPDYKIPWPMIKTLMSIVPRKQKRKAFPTIFGFRSPVITHNLFQTARVASVVAGV